MTVIISFHQPNMIIMSADSRKITRTTTIDYHTGEPIAESKLVPDTARKIFCIPNIGCVSVWGDITNVVTGFSKYLEEKKLNIKTVEILCQVVDEYLKVELKPHEDEENAEDTGFHIGGFMPNGESRLYHVFYGRNRPPSSEDEQPDYHIHTTFANQILYNGRNDYVDLLVKFINGIQLCTQVTIFENDAPRLMILSDYIIKFISQYTQDVGGSVDTVLIKPNNQILHIRTSGDTLTSLNEVKKYVDKLS